MNPTDLDQGDPGELGGVFDTITGTVNSIEGFGNAVGEATTFNMTVAMIWAVILFMFFSLFVRIARPWSEAAADRYRSDRPVIPTRVRRALDPKDARIMDLEDRLAAALARIAELSGDSSPSTEETNERQTEMVG